MTNVLKKNELLYNLLNELLLIDNKAIDRIRKNIPELNNNIDRFLEVKDTLVNTNYFVWDNSSKFTLRNHKIDRVIFSKKTSINLKQIRSKSKRSKYVYHANSNNNLRSATLLFDDINKTDIRLLHYILTKEYSTLYFKLDACGNELIKCKLIAYQSLLGSLDRLYSGTLSLDKMNELIRDNIIDKGIVHDEIKSYKERNISIFDLIIVG